ncbi:MAG: multiprotein bridging factor aMBF1 [Candidatus Bilamarchaeaceae archaeon]
MADMLCEICGNRPAKFVVAIEGAKITACPSCAHGGKILFKLEMDDGSHEAKVVSASRPIETEEVVEGYGQIVKRARERKGISIEELGKKLNETSNFIDHVEKEKMLPTIKLAQKLEKELGVKLIEKTMAASESVKSGGGSRDLTLADMLEMQNQRKKK